LTHGPEGLYPVKIFLRTFFEEEPDWEMTPPPRSLSLAYSALVAMMVFWDLSFVATKVALETFPTFTLAFTRFALASSFFLMILVLFGVYLSNRLKT
jgi:hypothetical protein